MKISQARKQALYEAIHTSIIDLRIALKLPAKKDIAVEQLEHEIWRQIMHILDPDPPTPETEPPT